MERPPTLLQFIFNAAMTSPLLRRETSTRTELFKTRNPSNRSDHLWIGGQLVEQIHEINRSNLKNPENEERWEPSRK